MFGIAYTIRRSSGRALGAIVLVALLAANSAARAERVLCFGEDGHVGVETALSGECAHVAETDCETNSTHFDAAPVDDCGPCEDIAFGSDLTQHAVKRFAPSADGLILLSNPLFVLNPMHGAAPDTARGDRAFTVPAIVIRSVTLQC